MAWARFHEEDFMRASTAAEAAMRLHPALYWFQYDEVAAYFTHDEVVDVVLNQARLAPPRLLQWAAFVWAWP